MRQQRIGLHIIIIVCACVYYYYNNNVVITETFVVCTRVEKPNRRSLRFVFVFFFLTRLQIYNYERLSYQYRSISLRCVRLATQTCLPTLLYLQTCIIKQSAVHSRDPAG